MLLQILKKRSQLKKDVIKARYVEDGIEFYIDVKCEDPFEIQDLCPEGNPTGWCFKRYYAVGLTAGDKWSVLQIDTQTSDFDDDPDCTKHYTGSTTYCQGYEYVSSKQMAVAIAATRNALIDLKIH